MGTRSFAGSGLAFALLLCVMPQDAAAQDDRTGVYTRAAAAFGFLNTVPGGSTDTQFGFTTGLGYQFTPWLASDAEYTGTLGGSVTETDGDARTWSIVVNARLYPLAPFGNLGSFIVQPYTVTGIGGGISTLKLGNVKTDDGGFVANLGLGFDVAVNERFGVYAEAAYKLFPDNQIEGITNVNAGARFSFP